MSEYTGNQVISGDFLRVLEALKGNINRNLNVAELAIIKTKNDDGTYSCSLLNHPDTLINCYSLPDDNFEIETLVVILFINSDFRTNIKTYLSGKITKEVEDKILHSKDYGIILSKNGSGSGAVSSVNGKTGNVVLTAEDVGALPADTPIPTVNVKRYNGIISQNDWELVGNRYMYTLPQSVHQLSNPMLLDYLVQGNTGYSHGMCNYEVLTNGNILFTSDLDKNIKYVILGE